MGSYSLTIITHFSHRSYFHVTYHAVLVRELFLPNVQVYGLTIIWLRVQGTLPVNKLFLAEYTGTLSYFTDNVGAPVTLQMVSLCTVFLWLYNYIFSGTVCVRKANDIEELINILQKTKRTDLFTNLGMFVSKWHVPVGKLGVVYIYFPWATSTWLRWEPQPVTLRQLHVTNIKIIPYINCFTFYLSYKCFSLKTQSLQVLLTKPFTY